MPFGALFILLASYRAERVMIWLHPEDYEKGIRRCRDYMRSVREAFSEKG